MVHHAGRYPENLSSLFLRAEVSADGFKGEVLHDEKYITDIAITQYQGYTVIDISWVYLGENYAHP